MQALILAAGRGERLRPLTDDTPKPLLHAGDASLLEHRVRALVQAGITEIVVNIAHLGGKIVDHLGDGARLGARIHYSDESAGALETGGGIAKALTQLQSDPFLVVNGDIWTDFPFAELNHNPAGLAHLVLVDNPEHNPDGDFCFQRGHVFSRASGIGQVLTFSGIGLYRRQLFARPRPERFKLAPVLDEAIEQELVSGEHYRGRWIDVGTVQRLELLRAWLD